jgi:hypothetical protein
MDRYRHEWIRLPGLFRRFEFEQVIEVEREFYVEEAGEDDRGVALYRIYYRPHPPLSSSGDPGEGVPARSVA